MLWLGLGIALKLLIFYFLGASYFNADIFVFILNPISSLLLAYILLKRRVSRDKIFFICSADIFVPLFGFLCIGLFYLLTPVFKLVYQEHSIDVYDMPLGEEEFERYSTVKKILLNHDNHQIDEKVFNTLELQPYMDIFDGEDLAKKVNAIEKLTELADSGSIKVLKKCLDGKDYEVRYFSNNALGKIEQNMMSRIESAKENVERHPMDNVAYNMRAMSYFDAYSLGIIDSSMEIHFLECALMDYLTSLSLNADQSYLYVRITQIYLKLNRYDDLISVAKMALETDIKEEDRIKVKFYLAEASFYIGDYESVKSLCSEVDKYGSQFELIRSSVQWWGGESA